MKRQERQHLKENELVHSIEATRDFMETRKREIGITVIAVVVIAVIAIGAILYRQRTQSRGSELLAEAMVALNARVVPAGVATQGEDIPAAASLGAVGSFPTESAKLNAALPKLQAAADAYPDSPAGITARYHLASALASLSRHDEAIQAELHQGTELGVNGTPAYFVNGRLLSGSQPIDAFVDVIDAELSSAKGG